MSAINILTVTVIVVFFFFTSTFFSPSSAQQDTATEFYFDGFSKAAGEDKNVTINGSAKVIKKGIIQLTNTTSHIMAHAFYSKKIRIKENGMVRSFSTAFTFATVPAYQQIGGHGYAFVISPSNSLSWALDAQYLGLFNGSNRGNVTNHIFAVEFDEARDLEFQDINDNHVGIDIDNLISNYSVPAGYYNANSTFTNMTLKDGNTIQTWIDFDSTNSVINVTISHSGSKPPLPLLSYKVNLSSVVEDYMYVGFSAATGLLSSAHYLLGWSFNMSGPAQTLPMTKVPKDSIAHSHMVLAIALSLSLSIVFVVFLAFTFYWIRKRRNADIIEAWEQSTGPHRYSYSELKQATKGFREKELLGSGGFGRVYMGCLPKTKSLVAVKRVSHESKQGLREFIAEIATIGRLRHRNLVQLLGWCRRHGDLMLVYDYMPNKSLDKYLFDQPRLILDWEQRFKIVKGVASGLFYLHEGWEQVVIHRDIKASNILLDSELNGRVGDFGLARLHDHGSFLSTTRVVGTLGYLAPELPKSGKATTRTDVFAFGTLLLEVACGRRPIEPKASHEELVLVDWVWEQWIKGNITSVVDGRLEGKYNEKEAVMVLKLGLMCSCSAPHLRPTMRLVVSYLEGEMPIPDVLIPPSGVAANVDGRSGKYSQSFASSSLERASSVSSDHKNPNGSNLPSPFATW